jgi:dipeptidyl aminopeptidase/acylaminoacyl peptidase
MACGAPASAPAGAKVAADPAVGIGGVAPTPGVAGPATAVDPAAPQVQTPYRLPAADVVDIVDAPPTPSVDVSPDGTRILLVGREALPSIAVISRPFERLAGIRIDEARGVRRRTRMFTSLTVQVLATGKAVKIAMPEGSQLTWPTWSPDGTRVAIGRYVDDGLELWLADATTGAATRVEGLSVNDVLGSSWEWMPGSQQLLVKRVVPGRGPAPAQASILPGPVVEDTHGRRAENRTYQDLLTSARDEAAFTHFATSGLVVVGVDGEISPLGEPALWSDVTTSPDGKFVLAESLQAPFSYSVPWYSFARRIEVLDRRAHVVRVVAEQPAAEEIPIGGVRTGARDVHWRPLQDATLVWTEALDDGDPDKDVEQRDRVMTHAAPFADTPEERLRVAQRLSELDWLQTPGQVLVTEYDRDRRWTTTHLYDLSGTEATSRVLVDRSVRDAYADPGRPVHDNLPDGFAVVAVDGGRIFLAGDGASPDGDRPFVDAMDLTTGKTERLFQSEGEEHGVFVDFVAGGHRQMLVRRESLKLPPNFFVVDGTSERQVTEFADPHPQLTGIDKRVLKYRRRDGVELSGTLYLPPGYVEGQRLPLVVWAYPMEFNDKDTAGQVRASPRTFTQLQGTSVLMFLTQGYAVLSDAAMPIVGDPETMNDTFLEQIVDSAAAAIDAAVDAGVADRDRVAIGGHSYGAFMSANLLAHSDLFRAGIARSGAYNRTLTPFGFQSERRTLWEAPETYVKVSPLFSADRINEPILLIHGESDANSGTFPLQSKRLFHALQGVGGQARLVLLPGESHGYAARESVLHVLAEEFEWLDTHVKNAAVPRG